MRYTISCETFLPDLEEVVQLVGSVEGVKAHPWPSLSYLPEYYLNKGTSIRNIIRNTIVVVSSVVITGGMAYAMQPPVDEVKTSETKASISEVQATQEAPTEPVAPTPVETPKPAAEAEPEAPKAAPVLSAPSVSNADLMTQAGIPQDQQQFADYIIQKESGWDFRAQNPTSSAYGLCQTMLSVHQVSETFKESALEQLQWCNNYAQRRFGGWGAAYNYWLAHKYW